MRAISHRLWLIGLACLFWIGGSCAQARLDAMPPKSIKDLIAQIEAVKPRPERVEELKGILGLPEPAGASRPELVRYLRQRATVANELGQLTIERQARRRLADLGQVMGDGGRYLSDLASFERSMGNYAEGIRLSEEAIRTGSIVGAPPVEPHAGQAVFRAQLGDSNGAAESMRIAERYGSLAASIGIVAAWYRHAVAGVVECHRGVMYHALGRVETAEAAYRKGIPAWAADMEMAARRPQFPYGASGPESTPSEMSRGEMERCVAQLAGLLAEEGRVGESEAILREQLLRVLGHYGRDAYPTATVHGALARVFAVQGRLTDAEWFARESLRVFKAIGIDSGNIALGQVMDELSRIQFVRGAYGDVVRQVEQWTGSGEVNPAASAHYIISLSATGKVGDAVERGASLLKRREDAYGAAHPRTAEARGAYAAALKAAGRKAEALRAFQQAMRALVAARGRTEESPDGVFLRSLRSAIIEEYVDLLGEMRGDPKEAGDTLIAEAFVAAEYLRTGAVQLAVAQSAARAGADPALVDAVRREQDLGRELRSLYSVLGRLVSASPENQLPREIADLRARIASRGAEQAKLAEDIARRYPAYANLVAPHPATLDAARASLKAGETLISYLPGRKRQFVWAVPQNGQVLMQAVALDHAALARDIENVRLTLEPFAHGLTEIPNFDAQAAWRLYEKLLQPVEAGFAGARHLVVVSSGPLASLPLALLPTSAPVAGAGADALWFESDRRVPWLLRKHSLTQIPSVNALIVLRALPARSNLQMSFFGVGDPWFSREQAASAQTGSGATAQQSSASLAVRGTAVGLRSPGRIDQMASTRLAQLERLPDTAAEVRDIAALLGPAANPELLLGALANEDEVKRRDLRGKRIVMFATHGLMPGELDGLNQPALALSAPELTGTQGDGLLTAEEILGLKLDADWVVLSACNTAGGAAEGAEALSGLGRSFFYAGARSLLVSNWPVETVSARLITTGVFAALKADPTLGRAEALRKTLLELIDKGEAKTADGKPAYAYAHPLFWAPFMLVGDGQ